MIASELRDTISTMSYIVRTYTKDFILTALLFALPFVLPLFNVGADAGILITASSTIFAIVAGFFIADAMANYLRLQTLVATENSALVAIADDARRVDGTGYVAVHKAIDDYMIAQLDSGTLNHTTQTQDHIDRLDASIHALSVGPEHASLYDHIISMQDAIISSRQEMALAAKKTLSTGHWMTLITFASLVAITVLEIRDGSLLANIITGLMIVGTQAVLIVLRDIDNNRLLERKLAYENPREVFHAISQPPYYPYFSEVASRIPDEDGRCRVGVRS